MSNLLPEQRMDKNGRLVTKHVRATPKALRSAANVPAPIIKNASDSSVRSKVLTAGQKAVKDRFLGHLPVKADATLVDKVGDAETLGRTPVAVSDVEMYSVLSVAFEGDAVVLLEAALRSGEDAKKYLNENGLSHLIEDNSEWCEEALRRRIAPESYIEARQALLSPADSPYYMDAIEAHSIKSLDRLDAHHDIYDGKISFADVQKLGNKNLSKWRNAAPLKQALRELHAGDAPYTIDHLKNLVDRYGDNNEYRIYLVLNIAKEYDIDFAMSLRHTNWGYAEYLLDNNVEPERAKALLRYEDDVETYKYEHGIYSQGFSYVKCAKYYDAGISVGDAAEDEMTDQQIEGITQGVESSLSGGWL